MEWSDSNSKAPSKARVVGHNVASTLYDYMIRVHDLGATENDEGEWTVNPSLVPVMAALHHVLGGGEVELKIVHRGHPDIVSELDRRVAESTRESNEINKAAGFYLTVTP